MLIRHANRIFARKLRKGKFWCSCDRFLLRPGQKCPVCGNREKRVNKG